MGNKNSLNHRHTGETKRKISEKNKNPSIDIRTKISEGNKGKVRSDETRKKLSVAHMGHVHSEDHKRKISESGIGRIVSEETRKKMRGRKVSTGTRRVLSIAHIGEKNHMWKGGLTPINKTIRHSLEYRLWREAVFSRDNWTCQECNTRGGELHPHHLKPFSLFPELRFSIANGKTLCAPCHRKTDTYGSNISKNKYESITT